MKEKEITEGFVTAVHRERYEVMTGKGVLYAKLKSGVYYIGRSDVVFPTVGDNVLLEYNPIGDSLIVETKERKSKFSRKDPDIGMGEQTIAANFDYVFIMMSLNFDFNLKRLERYLTVSWQSGGTPVVVLTKADIAENASEKLEEAAQIAIGVDICPISSVTGEGVEALKKYLEQDKTIVFLGSSGVGKSTFTNVLLGEEVMETRDIREDDSKGYHTTTHRQMFLLENGARIIDTPGMRELGMWVVDEGMEQSFSDLYELIHNCRFGDCTHTGEPGCAVRNALNDGTLSDERWKNYQKILKESNFQAKKERINRIKEGKRTAKNTGRYSRKAGTKDWL